MMKTTVLAISLCALAFVSGCTGYSWGTNVPEEYRTVAVPVFENLTQISELGQITTQYTLREFQREGTFKLARSPSDAAIEVQGVLKRAMRGGIAYDRGSGMRATEYRYVVSADVSFVDKRNGKVLKESRGIKAETTFLTQNDLLTGQKNAAARIANDLARQIVNEALALKFRGKRRIKGSGAVEGVQK